MASPAGGSSPSLPARHPPLVYGTAWKEERTEPLVRTAIQAGFRGIDTANQRKHYHEAGVGAAIRAELEAGTLRRGDLFVQTKFTFLDGQDHRLPYEPEAPVATQVRQSMASSLEHLGVDAVDSLVLHGPASRRGLHEADREAWRAMEALRDEGKVLAIGLSNVATEQLVALHAAASVKPAVVQNRTLLYPGADAATRAFCQENGIAYQGFSLLTAAPALLHHPVIQAPATRLEATPAQVVLRFWLDQGIVVLTGTTSPQHMVEDLAVPGLSLSSQEGHAIQHALGLAS